MEVIVTGKNRTKIMTNLKFRSLSIVEQTLKLLNVIFGQVGGGMAIYGGLLHRGMYVCSAREGAQVAQGGCGPTMVFYGSS